MQCSLCNVFCANKMWRFLYTTIARKNRIILLIFTKIAIVHIRYIVFA